MYVLWVGCNEAIITFLHDIGLFRSRRAWEATVNDYNQISIAPASHHDSSREHNSDIKHNTQRKGAARSKIESCVH